MFAITSALTRRFESAGGQERIKIAKQLLAVRRYQEAGRLIKANSHHDRLGRFALNDSFNFPPSTNVNTLQEAKRYYRDYVAGIWRVMIKRKSGFFEAAVNLNENQDHAYTKGNKAGGNRAFDIKRARLMERLLDAITQPDIILENGNRDLYVEKQQDGIYYAVVLEWKAGANEYRFRSAHYWDKNEYDNKVKTYSRPRARGKKAEKNKAPERLSKSSGASSTFIRLRDALVDYQAPPDCQGVVGQLSELDWEPLTKGSCYPKDSIDESLDFVKYDNWRVIYEGSYFYWDNEEPLAKAHGDNGDDIFNPHPNPFIRAIVEDYTESGMVRIAKVRLALQDWLDGRHYHQAGVTHWDTSKKTVPALAYTPVWTDADTETVRRYLSGVKPEQFSVDDMALLSKLLVRDHLSAGVMIDSAIQTQAQAFMMGHVQALWPSDGATPTAEQIAKLRASFPATLEGVVAALRLNDMAQEILHYGAQHAAENIVQLTDDLRGALQSTLMNHQLKRLAGDEAATPQKLQQTLFDTFGDMNRDWRRIAITEAGEIANQAFIAGQPEGTKIRRNERDDACPFCRSINGVIYTVVNADKPDKDGATEIWVGKNNIGRSGSANKRTENGLEPRLPHELWWPPAGLTHPHCRGWWTLPADWSWLDDPAV